MRAVQATALRSGAAGFHEQRAIIEIQRGNARAALAAAQQESPGEWQDIALALARPISRLRNSPWLLETRLAR